jgi:hypothetical protein
MAGTAGNAAMAASPAAQMLGIGDPVESDEERKKRLAAIQQSQQRLSGAIGSTPLSAAGSTLGLGV